MELIIGTLPEPGFVVSTDLHLLCIFSVMVMEKMAGRGTIMSQGRAYVNIVTCP